MIPLENKLTYSLLDEPSAPGTDRVERDFDRPTGLPFDNKVNGAQLLARFIGQSEHVLWMKSFIEKVAPLEVSVLITGPSGAGKTLVAEIIHSLSARSGNPFVKVNCSTIPEETFELTLFGTEKDLSRGIEQAVPGKIEEANGGTLLFSQIGDMPLKVQGRLLSFSESKELEKPGVKASIYKDVRILATTSRNLQDLIHKGTFREDLYYRLNVIFIHVPPLREHLEDLPDLVRHFIGRINPILGTRISSVSTGALSVLSSHDWPGNARELQNVLERAAILSDGRVIREQDVRMGLRETFAGLRPGASEPDHARIVKSEGICLKEALNNVEKDLIIEALSKTSGVQVEAAGMLGLTAKNLWKKIQKHSIKLERTNPSEAQKDS
jgi:two-component system, NtrC family, response regulator AtoC